MMRWLSWLALAAFSGIIGPSLSPAQPKAEVRQTPAINPEQATRRGAELVAELLSQKPESSSSFSGELSIRDARDRTARANVLFSIEATPTNTLSRYSALASNGVPMETLIIRQQQGRPNEYLHACGTNDAPRQLSREEVMRPFAGSDFWIADLGLDFLHWTGQAVTGTRMRRGQSCEILESTLPSAPPGSYSKVVSAIASRQPGVVIIYAEAFDDQGRLLKQFEPDKIERVAGQWQLQSITMRNRQTGSRSVIEFNLGQ